MTPDENSPRPVSRRTVLQGGAGLAATAMLPPPRPAPLRLRLMETSDLHVFVEDYDYFRDRPDETVGLVRTARLIEDARKEAANSLLFDNGDLIQGNPLGDFMALKRGLAAGEVHPMFKAMNLLAYDAATLGNHEFNYGLDFLAKSLKGPNFPFVCANVAWADGKSYLPPWTVLEREVTDEAGVRHRLRIGVIGFVTPQIVLWDHAALAGKIVTTDIVDAAKRHLPDLRARADLVVALSHSGIAVAPRLGGDENASYHLAEVPGLDVIFTGHSHRVFPGPDFEGHNGVDAKLGTILGIPAVMPGFWGSHLGIVDLTLEQRDGRWQRTGFRVEARPIYRREGKSVVALATAEPRIADAVAAEHRATLDYIRQPIGHSTVPITTWFALIGDDPAAALVNAAQSWYARPLLAQTPHAGLPLLSAAAPFKAGGIGGPENFTAIPAGALALKHVADLYIFPNLVRAVRLPGAMVKEWLERSAAIFATLDPAASAPQDLIDRRMPAYNFDVIAGLTYRIDVTRPPRYAPDGTLSDTTAERIVDLRHQGQPIDLARDFVVVTNNYRADGGGHFPGLDGSRTVLEAPDPNRDAILRYIQAQGTVTPDGTAVWRFAATANPVTAVIETAPEARGTLAGHTHLRDLGDAADGFTRLEVEIG
ncbi:MAG TPA: bifunctional 2',3'-cyclic-nucleotide 2'-phosphodiesterase/3'-nucleotidase [Stellaceae bacterium]|nr:bifunctional 2',3'-cyclic-nucleotide 2'-phosphodiesterase/3'-nucleotidase [Stellaceae bacterium]